MAVNNVPMGIESVLNEVRVFPPPRDFARRAHLKSLGQYRKLYRESIQSPEKFWSRQAKAELVWFKRWTKTLKWEEPYAKWFVGGRLNVSYNCLDLHLGSVIVEPIPCKPDLSMRSEVPIPSPGKSSL